MVYSTVMIVEAAHRETANAMGAALGYGPGTYTVPLSDDGETVTHYGAHAVTSEDYIDILVAALLGDLPSADWATVGLDEASILAALAAMTISAPGSPIDINSASLERLQALLGVSAEIASNIQAGRPWDSLALLESLAGVDESDIVAWSFLAVVAPGPATSSPSGHFNTVINSKSLMRL